MGPRKVNTKSPEKHIETRKRNDLIVAAYLEYEQSGYGWKDSLAAIGRRFILDPKTVGTILNHRRVFFEDRGIKAFALPQDEEKEI